MTELTRTQILNGTYTYPSELVKLIPTKHFLARLEERGLGLDCIPTLVRVTKENIHSAKTEDGDKLTSVVVRLKYNSSKYIFLAMNPFDGACKTLWFRDRRRIYESGGRRTGTADKNSEQAVHNDRGDNDIPTASE